MFHGGKHTGGIQIPVVVKENISEHRLFFFFLFRRSVPVVYALHTDWNLASAFQGQMIRRRKPASCVVVFPGRINLACTLQNRISPHMYLTTLKINISMIDVARVGRLSIGTPRRMTFQTCSRSPGRRATITTDTAMSFRNVERCDHVTFCQSRKFNYIVSYYENIYFLL